MTEEWTTLVFRNGCQIHLPQTAHSVIDQMAAGSKAGSLSFVTLSLRDDGNAVVSLLEVIAVVARAIAADGNMRMLPSTHVKEADRLTEIQRDADGKIIGSLKPTGLRPRASDRIEQAGITLPPSVYGVTMQNVWKKR